MWGNLGHPLIDPVATVAAISNMVISKSDSFCMRVSDILLVIIIQKVAINYS